MTDTLIPERFDDFRTPNTIDQLLRDGFEPLPATATIPSNLIETWGTYWLQLSLPGIDPRSLEIQVVARQVSIHGTYHTPIIDDGSFVWKDIHTGPMSETFTMPAEVDGDHAEAHFEHGILTVRLPKVAYLKPKSVVVHVGQ